MFYNEFTSPFHKNHTRKNIEKTKKIPTPPQVTENRPSSKTSVFVTYLPPKSNDWTPPWDPPRSPQKVPKPTRGAPENPQSSPRALQDPQDVLGATKPDDRLHLDVTGHQPKKWVAEYHTKENHTDHMLHEFTTHLSTLLQARIRIHRPT